MHNYAMGKRYYKYLFVHEDIQIEYKRYPNMLPMDGIVKILLGDFINATGFHENLEISPLLNYIDQFGFYSYYVLRDFDLLSLFHDDLALVVAPLTSGSNSSVYRIERLAKALKVRVVNTNNIMSALG